jgi:hypothetical protein
MSSNHNRHVHCIHDLDNLLDADFYADLYEPLVYDVENERLTGTLPTTVAALERRLEDCIGSEDYVAVIRALVATRDPAAIRVLASLLDSTGPIAEEAIAGLITFGEAVVPAMRRCTDADDYDTIRHGRRVLAALGDAPSEEWLRADDDERMAAYLERKGWSEDLIALALEPIPDEADEPESVE